MSLEQTLENVPGNLKDAYKQCQRGTMQHVDDVLSGILDLASRYVSNSR